MKKASKKEAEAGVLEMGGGMVGCVEGMYITPQI
jgi:hypothetical protein